MTFIEKISSDIKTAMLAREKEKLEALRAVKSAILLVRTEKGAAEEISDEKAISIIQKLIKQRKESAEIYKQNNRPELADKELLEARFLEAYLPKQISDDDLKTEIAVIIKEIGAQTIKDMGKVMAVASKKLAGKAEGKKISEIVKGLLPV
ncbi:MAG: GatB/YqeY domain-containing protein [Bacteroidota bacterium]